MGHTHSAPFTRAQPLHQAWEDENLTSDLPEVLASAALLLLMLGLTSLGTLVYVLHG
jgi:hypothetical protein